MRTLSAPERTSLAQMTHLWSEKCTCWEPSGARQAIQRCMMSGLETSHPLRIFLVEDHADTLDALCLYLKHVGHTVRFARTKKEALKKIVQGDCDVLISDIGLSDGNGWDLIQEMGDFRPQFAIAMSGYGTAADRERSAEAGFRHHLIKPVSLEKLAAVLDEAGVEVHRH
jgi:CheY-like chemotaxis protein